MNRWKRYTALAVKRIILAPMEGVTDKVFRDVFFSLFGGVSEAFSPFISVAPTVRISRPHLKDLIPGPFSDQFRLVPQVLGREAQPILDLDGILWKLGFDEININLGCPSSTVTKKGKGAALLPDPENLSRMLKTIAESCRCALSLKVRLGMFCSSEILELIDAFNELPISEITLHPRTGIQQYSGSADLAAFRHLAGKLRTPLIYNGDIRTCEDLRILNRIFPTVRGWMVGRGLLMNPFLAQNFTGFPSPPAIPSEPWARARLFIDRFHEQYRAAKGKGGSSLGRTKAIAIMMLPSFQGGDSVAVRAGRASDYPAFSSLLDDFLGSKPAWKPEIRFKPMDRIKPFPELIAIAAVDESGVIGCSGGIPWNLSEDMAHFREITKGGAVIMGRRTFDSLPALLDDRITIVLSRCSSEADIAGPDGIGTRGRLTWNRGNGPWLCRTLQDAASLVVSLGHERAWICGGGQIYAQALDQCSSMIITRVSGIHQGDASFPEISDREWAAGESRTIGPGQRVQHYRARCLCEDGQ
jgi:tRNA-dihydrouridine synthase/dihydrofolate reductase